ncbi:hypothetical protein [Nocardia iowensis]|uniref:Uncharacterized protein n=1 Tax=Nocardia iowensis TaxID=204891 RepID=A0ABX8RMF3_NOCIO|nr:hypothetical protein [Nocardia iowensis]QXN90804.1 hypothetical protein KV110_36450 [Nocardia iowensis]
MNMIVQLADQPAAPTTPNGVLMTDSTIHEGVARDHLTGALLPHLG